MGEKITFNYTKMGRYRSWETSIEVQLNTDVHQP